MFDGSEPPTIQDYQYNNKIYKSLTIYSDYYDTVDIYVDRYSRNRESV